MPGRSQIKRSNPSDRRAEIIAVARELYETKGLAHTTVKDITETIGVTRSLFYHYFPDKDAVTEAVLDDYIDEFHEAVQLWDESREPLNVRKALHDCIKSFRFAVFDKDPFRIDLASNENASLYLRFASRSADMLAHYLVDHTAKDYGELHELQIENLYDLCYMLIAGMVGYMRYHPDASDEVLESLVAQTLHLDLDNKKLKIAD